MYFKVYAQNCQAAEPIKEIAESDLNAAINELVNKAIDMDLVNPDNVSAAYQTAKVQLDEYEILNCGDYCIVAQDSVPQERPTMCGFDTDIFES